MKNTVKIVAVVMALVFALGCLCACGANTADNTDTTAPAEKAPATRVIDINLTEEEYAFGVDKAQPELLEEVNKIIAEIKADGTFDDICNHYFGDGTPVAVKSGVVDAAKDQLVVATNAAFEPFEYTKGDDYFGIDMEIAALIAEKLGKELVISNMSFDAVCLSVGQHKADIAMAGLTVKEERKEHVNFSDSYYIASQKLIVKGDDTSFDDCTAKEQVEAKLAALDPSIRIGVQTGTTGQFYVEGDEGFGFAGLPAEAVPYANGSLAVQDLINGNVDFVIIDSAPADCITASINALA